jgi:hypothetical protein
MKASTFSVFFSTSLAELLSSKEILFQHVSPCVVRVEREAIIKGKDVVIKLMRCSTLATLRLALK